MKYSIDFGKRKHIYITIRNGEILVKAPIGTSKKYIEETVRSKEKWILEKLKDSSYQERPTPKFQEGDEFYILGEKYRLEINFTATRNLLISCDTSVLSVQIPLKFVNLETEMLIQKAIAKFYKQLAVKEVSLSADRIQKLTGLTPLKVTVKKLNRSWGRCCSNGNISINMELVKYRKELIDYVLLHEFCHLKHMNHSKEFWGLVAYYMPDYKQKKKELRNCF